MTEEQLSLDEIARRTATDLWIAIGIGSSQPTYKYKLDEHNAREIVMQLRQNLGNSTLSQIIIENDNLDGKLLFSVFGFREAIGSSDVRREDLEGYEAHFLQYLRELHRLVHARGIQPFLRMYIADASSNDAVKVEHGELIHPPADKKILVMHITDTDMQGNIPTFVMNSFYNAYHAVRSKTSPQT